MPKCFRDFVSISAKKIHFPGIFIGQYDLPPIIARDEWRNRGFGNPKPVGNLHRPVFSQLAKYLPSPRNYINDLRRRCSSFPHTHHIQNGLHRFLFHRLGRRPQGVQGPGTCSRTPPRASTRAVVCASTYLDLGRLEGGDRAGERGSDAGHFVCGVCVGMTSSGDEGR